LAEGKNKEEAALFAKRQAEKTKMDLEQGLFASSDRLPTHTKDVNENSEAMNNVNYPLNNSNLTPQEESILRQKLEYYCSMRESAIKKQEESVKELQALSDPDIHKSSFSDLFYNLIDNYRGFLDVLSSEQMVIMMNLFGYVSLTGVVTSIITVLMGDHIIKYLKLETKYPQAAKYIRYKQTINKLYLSFNIVSFYFLIILFISLNIFMFLYDYFV